MAQLVNVIAPIFTSGTDTYRQTIFYPLQLFANNVYGTSLSVFVDCKTYNTGKYSLGLGESTAQQNNIPYLDVSAAYDSGNLILNVINKNKDEPITTDILSQNGIFSGNFTVFEVNGPDIKSGNDFGKETVKTVEKTSFQASTNKFIYTFPPHSFTMIKGKMQK